MRRHSGQIRCRILCTHVSVKPAVLGKHKPHQQLAPAQTCDNRTRDFYCSITETLFGFLSYMTYCPFLLFKVKCVEWPLCTLHFLIQEPTHCLYLTSSPATAFVCLAWDVCDDTLGEAHLVGRSQTLHSSVKRKSGQISKLQESPRSSLRITDCSMAIEGEGGDGGRGSCDITRSFERKSLMELPACAQGYNKSPRLAGSGSAHT